MKNQVNSIAVPNGATHVFILSGEKRGKLDLNTFAGLSDKELRDMGDGAEFAKIVGKGAKAKVETISTVSFAPAINAPVINQPPVVVPDSVTPDSVQMDDLQRANGILTASDATAQTKAPRIPDVLRLSPSAHAWNQTPENTQPEQTLQNNALTAYDVIPVTYNLPDITLPSGAVVKARASAFQILVCSDNGLEIGRPFNPGTYSLLNNQGFLNIIGEIMAVMDSLGFKVEIVSSGTLAERERQFISLRIVNVEEMKVDETRTIRAFLNCLNSIPSNASCNVTFANNCFVVCCKNTFARALRRADDTPFHASIKHTKGMKAMLADVPVMVESFLTGNQAILANCKAFAAMDCSLGIAESIFSAFLTRTGKNRLPKSAKDLAKLADEKFLELAGFDMSGELTQRSANTVETLKKLYGKAGKGNKGETMLDTFQAATEYFTHASAGDSDNAMKQIQSSELGSGAIAKLDFYETLVGLAHSKGRLAGVAKVGDTVLRAFVKKSQEPKAA